MKFKKEDKLKINLVICTRNRNELLLESLDKIKHQKLLPDKIVIVDSSEPFKKLPIKITNYYPEKTIFHISSAPGLPFQRNQGINFLRQFQISQEDLISFIDDDIRLSKEYFAEIFRIAEQNPDVIGFTGVNAKTMFDSSFLGRMFLLNSNKQGKILKSGKTTQPFTQNDYEITDWAPGGSMNYRFKLFQNIQFRNEIKMYGEDLDFSLRIPTNERIFVIGNAKYNHLESNKGKDNLRVIMKYTDLSQFMFALEHPKRIKKIPVIWSIIGMMISNMKNAIINRDRNLNIEALRGHILFFQAIIKNQKLLQ